MENGGLKMDRSKIDKIINEIDNILQKNCDDDFNLAMYLYVRYGLHHFKYYIDDNELEEINKVLKRHSTLFDEDINDEVRLILNDNEDDEEEED